MKKFWKSGRAKVLIALLAVLFGVMIGSIYTGGSGSLFSNMVTTITRPFQRVSASISGGVSQWFQQRTDTQALYEENQRLQKELSELRTKVVDYDTVKYENEQFRLVIDTVRNRKDWVVQPAMVIARDGGDRFHSFTIDRGKLDGISYLDPVMSADGLVGYVSEVGSVYAKVLTILDVEVDVGAYASSIRETGVLSGKVDLAEGGQCAMEFLPQDSQMKEGDLVLTSGSLTGNASMYPRDIYIGKVVRIEPDAHGTAPRAVIQPGTEIAKVKDVYVITQFEGQGE